MRTGLPAERGCCRPLVVRSMVPQQYLVPRNEACAVYADQKGTQDESADRAVRTSSLATCTGRCFGLLRRERRLPRRKRERERGCHGTARTSSLAIAWTVLWTVAARTQTSSQRERERERGCTASRSLHDPASQRQNGEIRGQREPTVRTK